MTLVEWLASDEANDLILAKIAARDVVIAKRLAALPESLVTGKWPHKPQSPNELADAIQQELVKAARKL